MNKHLTLVVKTVERCNLNCSYCYFFNGNDQSYKFRPKFISRQTIDELASFLKEGVDSLGVNSVSIGLHGGEPLMQPKEDLIYLVETLTTSLSGIDFYFTLQTNATLVTKKWINLLNKYKISVGVSIDGPQKYHDQYRVDHNGFGSYDQVVKGIKLLQENLFQPPGCLTVVNPLIPAQEFYQHILDLGFKSIDFLLPDYSYNNLPPHPISAYKDFMIDVFDAWIKNDNASISIRKFKSIILQLTEGKSLVYGFGKMNKESLPILAIRSDGAISPTDELMSTDPKTVTFTNLNIQNASLSQALDHKIFHELRNATDITPTKCKTCCWYNACGSGSLVNRFSADNRFNNPSIYCEALEEIFAHISAYLIQSGVDKDMITDNLFKKYENCA